MEKTNIWKDCPFCVGGKQTQGGTEVDCPNCSGIGLINWGAQTLDENVFQTHKILESTDPSEYIALTPGNVALYNLIISAGTIDLGPTTMARAVLWGMFGEGTTTRTNLIALVS